MKPQFPRLFTRLFFRMSLSFTAAEVSGSWVGSGTSTAQTEPDVHKNPAKPRPGQVYTGGKIDGHRSVTQRDRGAGRRQRLPPDRGCAGDTATVTSLTGDTARGHIAGDELPAVGHPWPPHLHHVPAGHVPQSLAAAAGAHPGCVGGPWLCPCRDIAVTCSASPSWMERWPHSPALSCLICLIICTGQQITQLWAFCAYL